MAARKLSLKFMNKFAVGGSVICLIRSVALNFKVAGHLERKKFGSLLQVFFFIFLQLIKNQRFRLSYNNALTAEQRGVNNKIFWG